MKKIFTGLWPNAVKWERSSTERNIENFFSKTKTAYRAVYILANMIHALVVTGYWAYLPGTEPK